MFNFCQTFWCTTLNKWNDNLQIEWYKLQIQYCTVVLGCSEYTITYVHVISLWTSYVYWHGWDLISYPIGVLYRLLFQPCTMSCSQSRLHNRLVTPVYTISHACMREQQLQFYMSWGWMHWFTKCLKFGFSIAAAIRSLSLICFITRNICTIMITHTKFKW